jgi:pyrimidine-specific ribonucleoside hydrolase
LKAGTAGALALIFCSLLPAAETLPVIIDTDCGSDDLMAIAFLLARRDVRIEAIAVDNGLAHVAAGAANVLRLLELGGRGGIPVFLGRESPLHGRSAFPDSWREISDTLLRDLKMPAAHHAPQTRPAADYLADRLRDRSRQVRILALGPLTNFGEVLPRNPDILRGVEMVIMGGAIRVSGNLGDGGDFKTDNRTAEWNLFVDPLAASRVFGSGARIRLVPLDATNHVPINSKFLGELRSKARTPLGEFVTGILDRERVLIDQGASYAWDPLAAVALVEPAAVAFTPLSIAIKRNPPEDGRTAEVAGRPNAEVGLDADPGLFRKTFLGALSPHGAEANPADKAGANP